MRGSRIEGLRQNRQLDRSCDPDGRFSVTAVRGARRGGRRRPGRSGVVQDRVSANCCRSDAAGALTRVRVPDDAQWAARHRPRRHALGAGLRPRADRARHARGDGDVPAVPDRGLLHRHREPAKALARASDGAMWAADDHCERVFRITDAGIDGSIPATGLEAEELAADATGGMWFAGAGLERRRARDRRGRGDAVHIWPDARRASTSRWPPTERLGGDRDVHAAARITPGGHAIARVASPVPARPARVRPRGRTAARQPGAARAACAGQPGGRRATTGRRHCGSPPAATTARSASGPCVARGGLRMTVREPASVVALRDPRRPARADRRRAAHDEDRPRQPWPDRSLPVPGRAPAPRRARGRGRASAGRSKRARLGGRRRGQRRARDVQRARDALAALRGRCARARRRRPRGGRCGRRGRTRPAPPARPWPRSGARRSAPGSRARGRSAAVRSVSSDGGAMKMRIASGIVSATWRAPWTSISSTTDAPSAVRFSSSERSVP